MKPLLAKSSRTPETPRTHETLVGHTGQVLAAAREIVTLIGDDYMRAIGAEPSCLEPWRRAVALAAWMHDWGKANACFQALVRGSREVQGLRHESLSLILADELESWLAPAWQDLPEWARLGTLYAIAGHHLRFPDAKTDRPGREIRAYTGHLEFRAVLESGVAEFGLSPPPPFADRTYSLSSLNGVASLLNRLHRKYRRDFAGTEKALIAGIKAALLNADLAGSVLPRSTQCGLPWLTDSLRVRLEGRQIAAIASGRLGSGKPWAFQQRAAEATQGTTLLEAACGGGKTVAAYLWASRHAAGKRLFFCYPTTTTASEGFAGYMREPDFDALLVHGRAHVDYELLRNMPERTREEIDGLEALEMWPVPAVVCTAHTVLGILESVRRGLYAWPSVVQSAFVFDEIHAFSDRLFSYLLRFLEAFPGLPVLLMTATLPPRRRLALDKACVTRGGIYSIQGPPEREQAPRYTLGRSDTQGAWSAVCDAIEGGRTVLWVSNTVARAISVFETALERGTPALCFHSRFRYRDRVARQNDLMQAFSQRQPILAVTTQVAEMSLDISANLLVSDTAPIPAMIQRLGRLNRFDAIPATSAPALFLDTESDLPYDADALAGSTAWLDHLGDGAPKSQADLVGAFLRIADANSSAADPANYCEHLDGLWRSRKDVNAIEEAGFTVEILREEDISLGAPAEFAIPMPFPKDRSWQDWPREGRYLVAPRHTVIYDQQRGAQWRNN